MLCLQRTGDSRHERTSLYYGYCPIFSPGGRIMNQDCWPTLSPERQQTPQILGIHTQTSQVLEMVMIVTVVRSVVEVRSAMVEGSAMDCDGRVE